MLIIFMRAAFLYLFMVIIMRTMGKKQIGEMQPTELVVALVIADLSAVPMENLNTPLFYGIIPILTLFFIEETLSYIALKSDKARQIIYGKPSIVIQHGKILESELRKQHFNINDLLEELRLKGHASVEDVEFAILETSGQLSTIPKSNKRPVEIGDMNLKVDQAELPVTAITDGRIHSHNLRLIGLDEDWLMQELKKHKISSPKEVLLACITAKKELIYQRKNEEKKIKL